MVFESWEYQDLREWIESNSPTDVALSHINEIERLSVEIDRNFCALQRIRSHRESNG